MGRPAKQSPLPNALSLTLRPIIPVGIVTRREANLDHEAPLGHAICKGLGRSFAGCAAIDRNDQAPYPIGRVKARLVAGAEG